MQRSLINIKTSKWAEKLKSRSILLMIFLIIFSASKVCSAEDFQDEPPYKTKLSISGIQLPNNQIKIQVLLRAKVDNQYIPVANSKLEIYTSTDSTNVLLGEGTSNEKGILELMVTKDQLSVNEDGYYSITGSFEGDENYKSNDDELLFKPAILEMEAEESDSVKTITIKIYEDSEDATPLEDIEVTLQVPRMYSNLTIATESTDEDGVVSFKFPNDLPGGKNGTLQIIAKANDTDDYASLQSQIENNWGIPLSVVTFENRTLWTPNAPLWMVIVFAILMSLVWGHFLIIIYKLYLINKEGKSLAQKG